jgi:hypothetical protein
LFRDAAHGEGGDVVLRLALADEVGHDRVARGRRFLRHDRGTKTLEPDVERLVAAFYEAVGVEEEERSDVDRHDPRRSIQVRDDAKWRKAVDVHECSRLARRSKQRGEMARVRQFEVIERWAERGAQHGRHLSRLELLEAGIGAREYLAR